MSKPRINTIEDRQAWMRERQHPKIEPKMATEVERLLTVQEAAPLWGQSSDADVRASKPDGLLSC